MSREGRQLHFYVDEQTHQRLMDLVRKSPRKEMTAVIVDLIHTSTVIEAPPIDYQNMMKELHYIGHNLNQIATKANTTGNIEAAEYKRQAAFLRDAVLRIQQAVELPLKKNE